jgi:large subunit ribosomal protein L15
MPEQLNLSNLKPAQARKDRKRIGRGLGSGKGRYSGRGIKGQKSRAGSHAMRAGFEGGQMPLYMRTAKLRGNTSADAMPIGPFRTYSQPVNLKDLDRFDEGAEVTPESLKAIGLIRSIRKDVKLLGVGELSKKLTITVHAASATAREKVEAAGGTLTLLKEPKRRKPKNAKRRPEGRKPAKAEAAEPAAEPPVRDSGPVEGVRGNREVPPTGDAAPEGEA